MTVMEYATCVGGIAHGRTVAVGAPTLRVPHPVRPASLSWVLDAEVAPNTEPPSYRVTDYVFNGQVYAMIHCGECGLSLEQAMNNRGQQGSVCSTCRGVRPWPGFCQFHRQRFSDCSMQH